MKLIETIFGDADPCLNAVKVDSVYSSLSEGELSVYVGVLIDAGGEGLNNALDFTLHFNVCDCSGNVIHSFSSPNAYWLRNGAFYSCMLKQCGKMLADTSYIVVDKLIAERTV